MPRVSIGLPVHNGEEFLADTIESLLAQTFSDFELVISDNASDDRTESICRRYERQDDRIRYVRNSKNIGAAPNYNQLVRLARGELVRWHAHDDLCAPSYLELCVKALDSHPDAVLAHTRTGYIDESGHRIPVRRHFGRDGFDLRSMHPHRRIRWLLAWPHAGNAPFGLIRRQALLQTNLVGLYPLGDEALLAELSLRGSFIEIPEELFLRRLHHGASRAARATNRGIALWFDPEYRGPGHIDALCRLLWGYVDGIRRSPLTRWQRALCYAQVPCSTFAFAALGLDCLLRETRLRHLLERRRADEFRMRTIPGTRT
jgi:glycosyltransferase involved in cell wall biosynthesis